MLPLTNSELRLLFLQHVAARIGESELSALQDAGLTPEHLADLRNLSAPDLNRLAIMRKLNIAIALDVATLESGLRVVARTREMHALEDYFIRNGASCRMMNALFKISRKITHQRRIDCGVRRPSGAPRLPEHSARNRIYREWVSIEETSSRMRYYRLHQAFPQFAIDVLEAILRKFDGQP